MKVKVYNCDPEKNTSCQKNGLPDGLFFDIEKGMFGRRCCDVCRFRNRGDS